MSKLLIIIVVVFIAITACAQVPELQPELVFKAKYGDAEDEYGYVGIVERDDTNPVNKFYVSTDRIFLHDIYQENIKVYDHDGKYIRTISAKWEKGGNEYGLPAIEDILVHEGIVFILCQLGIIPPPEISAMIIFTFDLETGNRLEMIQIYNPSVARSKGGSYVVGAADLRIGTHNSIWISDYLQYLSFPIVRNGKAVQNSEHMHGVPGILFGSKRIIQNEKTGGLSLISDNNSILKDMDLNKPIRLTRSQKRGNYFVKYDHRSDEEILTTWDGREIGRFKLVRRDTWAIYPINRPCSQGENGYFYQVFADYDGLYLYRWSY